MPDRQAVPLRDAVVGGRTVVSKAAAILMTYLYGESQTFSEIVASTGLPLSTVHRLLWELTACRVLERTERGRYEVAAPVRRIGAARGPAATLESRAALVLDDLSQALDTEARLGVLRADGVAYIEKGRGRRPVTTFGDGAVAPVHGTAMGMVLLAFAPRPVVDDAVARLLASRSSRASRRAGPGPEPERVVAALRRIHLRHLAVMWNEDEPDRSALAVPVFGVGGRVAALEARVRDPSAQLAVVQTALVVAGRGLTRELASAPVRWHSGVVAAGSAAPARRARP